MKPLFKMLKGIWLENYQEGLLRSDPGVDIAVMDRQETQGSFLQ